MLETVQKHVDNLRGGYGKLYIHTFDKQINDFEEPERVLQLF